MKRRDIVIGILVIILLGGIIYWRQKTQKKEELVVPETLSVQKEFEDKFKISIPENVDKADLSDVSEGNGLGFATRKYENGKFSHTLLADLPEAAAGSFYEGWLMEDDSKVIPTGKLLLEKGGYILEFQSTKDYSSYKKVVVSLEKRLGKSPEKNILEGSF